MFSLNLDADGRVLSATLEKFYPAGVLVEALPDGNLYEYLYTDGAFVHSPLPSIDGAAQPQSLESRVDNLEQTVDTMLGVET